MTYEDDDDCGAEVKVEHPATSLATWKMEFNTPGGVAPGLGVPQSQIMDTGMYGVWLGDVRGGGGFIFGGSTIGCPK